MLQKLKSKLAGPVHCYNCTRCLAVLFYYFLFILPAGAQTDTVQPSSGRKFSDVVNLKGYIKDMHIFSFSGDTSNIISDNLVHNRLNFRIYPVKKISLGLEIRNRIFTGETVKNIPNYHELVDIDNGYVDLSWAWLHEPSVVALTQIDRAWISFTSQKWDIRAGRQRINWGTNLFWNSNDLFNVYSFVDFDYEERPGTDALRIQRIFKGMKSAEISIKPGKNEDEWIGAALFKINKWQYDFQFLMSWWHTDLAIGTGWAGNVKNAGFKGEVTYFHPQDNAADTSGVLSASVSGDYVFKSQCFLTIGFLYQSNGMDGRSVNLQNLFTSPLSAKTLMPTKYSSLVSVSYPFTPLFNGSLVAIYAPGVNTAFFMPSLSYSIFNNWELALFGQSVWLETNRFRNVGNGIYIRLKGSF